MYVQWDNLLPVRKSLEAFFVNFIDSKEVEKDSPPICWATVSPLVPNLEEVIASKIGKKGTKILESIQDQELEFFFSREYKFWYTSIKMNREDWIENNLFYSSFSDLWNDVITKIEDFCYAEATHGFNIEYHDNFADELEIASQDYIPLMEGSSSELTEEF